LLAALSGEVKARLCKTTADADSVNRIAAPREDAVGSSLDVVVVHEECRLLVQRDSRDHVGQDDVRRVVGLDEGRRQRRDSFDVTTVQFVAGRWTGLKVIPPVSRGLGVARKAAPLCRVNSPDLRLVGELLLTPVDLRVCKPDSGGNVDMT
jgi:hypothetical protein